MPISIPGLPRRSDVTKRVFSGILHLPFCDLLLSECIKNIAYKFISNI
ncbi:hypothetical protein CSCA_1675 [Clostridium scatologenes]|uniref:Uncharacterized protein n=1 Tax=Clostridium scatologenes TaxID=1548 RepID=A0A0E3M5S4_CLOSL|nr:hypothetical protein CSCA_1675 [Clostridium scatologenes]